MHLIYNYIKQRKEAKLEPANEWYIHLLKDFNDSLSKLLPINLQSCQLLPIWIFFD